MSASIKVGYLGPTTPRGPDTTTFGYMAAKQHFGRRRGVEFVNLDSHTDICVAVAKDEVQFGVVAIENVLEGVVAETLQAITKDAELHGGAKVCAEVSLPVELFYLRKKGGKKPPRVVLSHTVGLRACSRHVRELKERGIESDIRRSTAEAAYEASTDVSVAALASARAEQVYHLQRVVPHSVVDHPNSKTRFWVLSTKHARRTGKDKTAIVVELRQDRPGVYWRTLGCFYARCGDQDGSYVMRPEGERPNLLLPYSIPISGRRWEYFFLLEFAGHVEDGQIQAGLREFEHSGLGLGPARVIGSYPNSTEGDLIRQ